MEEQSEIAFQQLDLREKPILIVNRRVHHIPEVVKLFQSMPRELVHPQGRVWFLDDCDLVQLDDAELLQVECVRSGMVIDKTKHRIRFEDETETSVRVIVERIS